MLFAAMEDNDLAKKEVTVIKKKLGDGSYIKMKSIIQENAPLENTDIILDLKEKFLKNNDDIENFLKEIDKLIEADGEVNKEEIDLINSISYLLKNN